MSFEIISTLYLIHFVIYNHILLSIFKKGNDKGREHPILSKYTLKKLKEFYKPYSLELFNMINEEPFWKI